MKTSGLLLNMVDDREDVGLVKVIRNLLSPIEFYLGTYIKLSALLLHLVSYGNLSHCSQNIGGLWRFHGEVSCCLFEQCLTEHCIFTKWLFVSQQVFLQRTLSNCDVCCIFSAPFRIPFPHNTKPWILGVPIPQKDARVAGEKKTTDGDQRASCTMKAQIGGKENWNGNISYIIHRPSSCDYLE